MLCGDYFTVKDKENCEDGNTISGDGCNSTCMIEPGYFCDQYNGSRIDEYGNLVNSGWFPNYLFGYACCDTETCVEGTC